MNEASRNADLPIESLGAEKAVQLSSKDLESDVAIALEVASEIDDCHPPGAELAIDAIPIGEAGNEALGEILRPLFAHGKTLAPPEADRKRLASGARNPNTIRAAWLVTTRRTRAEPTTSSADRSARASRSLARQTVC